MIKQFLAYGNSDQASFRNDVVRSSFEVMTVPGTIAAYYQDATAGFVLSNGKPYLIDPRTPLFQDRVESPRPSHVSLAEWHGSMIHSLVASGIESGFELEPAMFDSDEVLFEMVDRIVYEQVNYAGRATTVERQIDRYRALLAEARGIAEEEAVYTPASPAGVVAPYFAVKSVDDPWWGVNMRIWQRCIDTRPQHLAAIPVVTVGGVDALDAALERVPRALGDHVLFWVTGLDERRATEVELRTLWQVVARHSAGGMRLANMYGGYFSIMLSRGGLAAFGNGLTYSESRAWPALASTGAAPARYYVPAIHAFLTPALAQSLVDLAPALRCSCRLCAPPSSSIVGLSYHELKEHFAAARVWEMNFVESASAEEVREQLREAMYVVQAVQGDLPPRSTVPTFHLETWRNVGGLIG